MKLENKIKWVSTRQTKNEWNDKLYSIIHGNQLDLEIIVTLDKPTSYGTAIGFIRNALRAKGFTSDTYKYIATSYDKVFMMYVQLTNNGLREQAGFSAKPIDEFIEVIQSMKRCTDIHYKKLDANSPINSQTFIALANKATLYKNGKAYSSTLKPDKLNFFNMTNAMLNEVFEQLTDKGDKPFPNYYEYTGNKNRKMVSTLPFFDNSGNGIVYYIIYEYDELYNLVHSLEVKAIVRNYELVPNDSKKTFYYANITNKALFVYAIIEKKSGKIVYIGATVHIEERICRHMNPFEKDSINTFLSRKNISNNSTLRGYDFWLKNPNAKLTAENIQKFRDHCVSWDEYEFRFLPLNNYVEQYKDLIILEWKRNNRNKNLTEETLDNALRNTAEACCMVTLCKQSPDKLIKTTNNMYFINKDINAPEDTPLFFCKAANKSNASIESAKNTLEKYKNLVSDGDFKRTLTSTLQMLRASSDLKKQKETIIPLDASMYEIFTEYALTVDEAMKLAVGLNIDEPLNSIIGLNTVYKMGVLSGIEHRQQIARELLGKAGFPLKSVK